MSAAVADFRPAGAVDRKLKKDQGVPKLELEPTEDVLSQRWPSCGAPIR